MLRRAFWGCKRQKDDKMRDDEEPRDYFARKLHEIFPTHEALDRFFDVKVPAYFRAQKRVLNREREFVRALQCIQLHQELEKGLKMLRQLAAEKDEDGTDAGHPLAVILLWMHCYENQDPEQLHFAAQARGLMKFIENAYRDKPQQHLATCLLWNRERRRFFCQRVLPPQFLGTVKLCLANAWVKVDD